MSLTSVRLSWAELLGNVGCADKIRIKYWKTLSPNDYETSAKLPVTTRSYLVEALEKYIEYTFQVTMLCW